MLRLIPVAIILIIGSASAVVQVTIQADIRADSIYADSVLVLAQNRLTQMLGPFDIDSLKVYITTSPKHFDSLTGESMPDWGAGAAIPYMHRIVIKSPLIIPGDKSLGELLAHEYTHIVLDGIVGHRSLPRWMNEGLAMYVSAEWGWADNLSIGTAVTLGTVIPLADIERLNTFDQDKAGLAYSESYLAVKHFLEVYGESSLRIFLQNIREGNSFEKAFMQAIGASQEAFEIEFRRYLSGRYNLIAVIFDSNIIWFLLGLVVIVGYILKRMGRHKRIKEMDHYDQLHSTDFDYGDEIEKPDEDKPWD